MQARIKETPRFERLAAEDCDGRDQALAVLRDAFADSERYGEERLRLELMTRPPPFYREIFVASLAGTVIGVGAIKAADWASDTHILYLSAVAGEQRGKGYARQLLQARLEWLHNTFAHGRVLVSTAKSRRFREAGFRCVSPGGKGGRELMLLEF